MGFFRVLQWKYSGIRRSRISEQFGYSCNWNLQFGYYHVDVAASGSTRIRTFAKSCSLFLHDNR
jgi:hypothetical protein